MKQENRDYCGYRDNGGNPEIALPQCQKRACEEHIEPEPQPGDMQDAFGRKVFQAFDHPRRLTAFVVFCYIVILIFACICLSTLAYVLSLAHALALSILPAGIRDFLPALTQALALLILLAGILILIASLRGIISSFELMTGVLMTTIALGVLLEPYISPLIVQYNLSVIQLLAIWFLPGGLAIMISGLKNGVFSEQVLGACLMIIALGVLVNYPLLK